MAKLFQEIKNKLEENKYKKLLHKATEWIKETVESEDGFSVPYKLDEETGALVSKTLTPNNFEQAFHIDIWNNMTITEQILTLIWYDIKKAKEQNRPQMSFILNPYENTYHFELDSNTLKLTIPTVLFENGQKTSYEHLHTVAKMSILLRDAHYKIHFEETGENKGNFNKNYMNAADIFVAQPQSYKKLIVQGYNKDELTQEEIENNKECFEPLTKEDKEDILAYLLQPRQEEWWKEYQGIEEIGERNVYYMGEDPNFELYKKTVGINKSACDKFVEENVKDADKNEVFFNLLKDIKEVENER